MDDKRKDKPINTFELPWMSPQGLVEFDKAVRVEYEKSYPKKEDKEVIDNPYGKLTKTELTKVIEDVFRKQKNKDK